MFEPGDRVRCTSTGDDGLPLVRYGFVRATAADHEPVVVMFDREINGVLVIRNEVELVSITAIELRFDGDDLLENPELRKGLMPLWQAEAESAGLDVDSVILHDAGRQESRHCWSLASVMSGGVQYNVRAMRAVDEPGAIHVRADVFGAPRYQVG